MQEHKECTTMKTESEKLSSKRKNLHPCSINVRLLMERRSEEENRPIPKGKAGY